MPTIKIGERKLQKLENRSSNVYMITIPTKWIEKMKLEKGEKLEWILDPEQPEEIFLRKAKEW